MTLGWCRLQKSNVPVISSFLQRVNTNAKEPAFELVLIGNDFGKVVAQEIKELPGAKI